MHPYDDLRYQEFPCYHWDLGCIKWVNQNGAACNYCISNGRSTGNRADDLPASRNPLSSQINNRPALRAAYWTCIYLLKGETSVDDVRIESAKDCSIQELTVAIYQVLIHMMNTILGALRDPQSRQESARKLQADHDQYPSSLLGLGRYLQELDNIQARAREAAFSFFENIVDQIFEDTAAYGRGPVKIIARSETIDSLLDPETYWWRKRIISGSGQGAQRMVQVVLQQNVKLQCRPFMLDNVNNVDLIQPMFTGMVALVQAAGRSRANFGNSPELRAAAEVLTKYGRYVPSLNRVGDFRDQLRREGLADRDARCYAFCEVMEAIAFSTSMVRGQRMVTSGLPSPFPVPT